jgi:hypothetical protein
MVRRLHRPDAAAEKIGDLDFGKIGVVPQRQDRSLAERKATYDCPRLIDLWRIERRTGEPRRFPALQLRTPNVGAAQVDHDNAEELFAALYCRPPLMQPEERLLCDLLSDLIRAHDRMGQPHSGCS